MTGRLESLESLHARSRARVASRVSCDGWSAHGAVLDRLAANVRVARSYGWTSCVIARSDASARFGASGVPPGEESRHPIPDWSTAPDAADRRTTPADRRR
jgi:hypothetical protein